MTPAHPRDAAPTAAVGHRVVVVGTSGSGKSTLARALAARLERPHTELDALQWLPGWREAPLARFRERVAAFVSGDCWVIDGNYSKARDLVWSRADTLIWLDYPLRVTLWRLWWRTWGRWWRRETLWGTNRERLWDHFTTRDSLFLWAIQTHRRRRREYPALLAADASHLRVLRFTSPRAAAAWLATVPPGASAPAADTV